MASNNNFLYVHTICSNSYLQCKYNIPCGYAPCFVVDLFAVYTPAYLRQCQTTTNILDKGYTHISLLMTLVSTS